MINNDCLRRLRYILDFDDSKMIVVFAQGGQEVTRTQLSSWLKKEGTDDYQECSDASLAGFLNGLINEKRGKRDRPEAEPEKRLNNNMIFIKLKIAFNLKAEEVVAVLALADVKTSKHELSAFFRRSDHKHYRECLDQILRNFLKGLQIQYRGSPASQ